MIETQYQVYDFASSARVDRPLWMAFNNWMKKFGELFVERWSNFSATEIQSVPLPIDAEKFEHRQEKWRTAAEGIEISFKDNTTSGMMLIERSELLRLLMDVLGDHSGDDIEDRDLTTVESSLSEMVFEQTLAIMGESWPEQESLSYRLEESTDQPNRSRMFAPAKEVLVGGIQILIQSKPVRIQLALAKQETRTLLGVEKRSTIAPNTNNRIAPSKIAEILVQVSATIGRADLGMQDLMSIAAGDIVVFDQRINAPITLLANDIPYFRGWPGSLEDKQALQIVSKIS